MTPLSGFRVGVTADRRADDLIAALERRGPGLLKHRSQLGSEAGEVGHLEPPPHAVPGRHEHHVEPGRITFRVSMTSAPFSGT
jgi:hypothetical protein